MEVLFEKFEIRECLKKDGGQCVYVAHHCFLGKTILLKTLDRQNVADPSILERFQREARTLARLDHPNIIKVLDFGLSDPFFYISFEYFAGRNLRALLAESLTFQEKLLILRRTAEGLDFAHRNGIIHRDLKPENILVNDRLEVKIADFGLALIAGESSLTQPSSIVGTPGYMSPEQIRGETLTPQSDLFSLGIVAYELFVGVNPFLGRDVGSTINNILSKKNDLDAAPAEIAPLLSRLLKKNRSERLKSAQMLLDMLPQEAPPSPTESSSPAVRVRRRSKALMPTIAAVLLVIVVFVLLEKPRPKTIVELPQTNVDTTSVQAPPETMQAVSPATVSESLQPSKALPEALPATLPGTLFVHCLPWAEVWIDGRRLDLTPMERGLTLAPGHYELRLLHPRFPAFVQNIRIAPQEITTVAVDLDTLFGFLSCRIYPWGEVYVDSEFQGVTPFAEPLRVAPGRHLLRVVNQQFGSVEQPFEIARRDTFHYQYNFEQTAAERRP